MAHGLIVTALGQAGTGFPVVGEETEPTFDRGRTLTALTETQARYAVGLRER